MSNGLSSDSTVQDGNDNDSLPFIQEFNEVVGDEQTEMEVPPPTSDTQVSEAELLEVKVKNSLKNA